MSFPFTTGVYNSSLYEYTIQNFNVTDLTFPSGSSGLTIGFGVLVLNFEELKTTLYKSNDILLNRNESDTDFILTLPVIPDDNGTRIAVVHYQFVEEINNAIFRLNDSNCWGIKVVGID